MRRSTTPITAATAAAAAAAESARELPLVNHLLQHTLRSLCAQQDHPQFWVYSIFWRILPRNYPPPKWDTEAGPFDRSKGNKRNWILVWEDGYCDFVACATECKEARKSCNGEESAEGDKRDRPLQPELFFKMSHDVYNYGEGLMGKIAAERSHKWIFKDPSEQDKVPFLSTWQASADSYPRTWEAQFKSGIQTIAVIAVGEGLLQLGSTRKVFQDVDFVVMLQRKFSYLQSIPGVFAQTKMTRTLYNVTAQQAEDVDLKPILKLKKSEAEDETSTPFPILPLNTVGPLNLPSSPSTTIVDLPSMYNSLQVLLSKLPAVTPHKTTLSHGASSATCPSLVGLMRPEVLLNPQRATLFRPPLPPSNPPLANPSDDFDSYHCVFGQPIS